MSSSKRYTKHTASAVIAFDEENKLYMPNPTTIKLSVKHSPIIYRAISKLIITNERDAKYLKHNPELCNSIADAANVLAEQWDFIDCGTVKGDTTNMREDLLSLLEDIGYDLSIDGNEFLKLVRYEAMEMAHTLRKKKAPERDNYFEQAMALQEQVNALTADNQRLAEGNQRLTEGNQRLIEEIDGLKLDLTELKAINESLIKEIAELKLEVSSLTEKTTKYEDIAEHMTSKMHNIAIVAGNLLQFINDK